jgi:hypothetical protein
VFKNYINVRLSLQNTKIDFDGTVLPIRIIADHILVELSGGKIGLIDTGAPSTFGGKGGCLNILGRSFEPAQDYLGVTCSKLSEFLGVRIDYVVGCDVLSILDWKLDWQGGTLSFFRDPQDFGGTVVPVKSLWGIPIVDFLVKGHVQSAVLDTGAPLQYKPREFEAGAPLRVYEDFSPILGKFATPVFKQAFTFGGMTIEGDFGHLPEPLEVLLELAGVRWVLGSDVLRQKPIGFSLRNRRIHILPSNNHHLKGES